MVTNSSVHDKESSYKDKTTMDENQANEYPNYVRTIRRSKRKHSIVDSFYIRFLWIIAIGFGGIGGISIICGIIDEGLPNFFSYWNWLRFFWLIFLISVLLSAWYSILNKGSLVDTIKIDYNKQEIRVLYYSLFNRKRQVTLPFEGMEWNVLPGGYSSNRIRIFPKEGKRIVVCEGTLGWTYEDYNQLRSALSKITEEGHWTETILK